MPERCLSLFAILFLPLLVFAQRTKLRVLGSGSQLYLNHTVVPKENFYSVGRLYNVSPRDLASFNHLSLNKGLNAGQSLKIPLGNENFIQNTNKDAAEALVPVYHQVSSGETLYRIGVNFGNIPLDQLKAWNRLSDDNVNKGADMIVGFLRVNKNESALAAQDYKGSTVRNSITTSNVSSPKEENPVVRVNESSNSSGASSSGNNSGVPEKPTPVLQAPPVTNNSKEGFFKTEFDEIVDKTGVSSVTGTAAVFKSTSGWQDAKYYCFNNDALPGSIVRIEIPGTSRFIYAKVLDAIPDIKQNEGLTLVLSNAGADALGITSDKFDVTLTFYK